MERPDAPEPQGRASPRAFLGRAAELDELSRGLDVAVSGSGRLYLVSGEPGIGKTRLADELTATAAARGVPAFWGRCWEAGGAPAYFPWMDVLAGLAERLDDAELTAALGEGAAAVCGLAPAIAARLGGVPPAISGDADEARFRLFRAVLALIRRAAARSGVVIVFEDLHAADESSLLLLSFVARELRSARAFVVATYRDVEARLSESVGAALGRLSREGATISLGRLRQGDVERLLRARLPCLEPADAARIFERTRGNPLFVEEIARALAAEEGSSSAVDLPIGIRDVLRERLARVPADARECLDAFAIAGDEVSPLLVAEVVGATPAQVTAAFAACVRAGVLRTPGEARYRFSHGLVREVLEQDLAVPARERLHGRVAAALAPESDAAGGAQDAEIAHHLLAAGVHAREGAIARAISAAERATSVLAFEEATLLLERALRAVEGGGAPEVLEGRVLVALGRVCIRRGQGSRGQELCLRAAELARKSGNAELLGAAAVAYGLELTPALVNRTLVKLLQEALEALPPGDSAIRVRLTARLAAAMQPHPDLAYPIGLAREAVEAATRLGDEDVLLDALFLGMSTMMDIVDPAERLLQNLRIEQLVTVRRDAERLLRTHARLVFDHMELGELAEADARIDAFERLGKDTGADRYLWRVPLFRSMRAMMHGRFAESEALVEQARELGTASKDPQFERCYVLHREGLLRMWERHDDMIAYDVVARPMRAMLYSGPHWQNGGTALTYSRVEDFENAKLYADLVPQDDWPLVHNPPAFAHVGEPMAHVGGVALVTRVYVLLLPARERCISWGWTKILWEGTATRVLGLLAARLGRTEEAISHFESAIETLAELAAYPMLHRTRYEYGRWLLSLGGAHEGTGRALVEEARAGAADLGMTGLVRLAEKRLGEARAPVTPPAGSTLVAAAPETGGLPFAFVAEGEYWTVQYEAATFRLKDSLGLQYLTRLFAEPHRSIHVLELSGSANEPSSLDAGDAGEHLDAAARDEYRLRLTELREQLEAAKASGAVEQATRLEEEMDFLEAELSRAFGLGGRVRRAGAASERARSAVQRRIRSAVERVREYSPGLAALLERTVKTGTTCVFSPENARDAAARD